ncbi:MAG: tetratricopeptide repeat protein [Pseudomonadota bacterium]
MNQKRLNFRFAPALIAAFVLTFLPGPCDKLHAEGALVKALIPYVQQNFTKALELLEPLAAQGDAVAQLTLGRMYLRGEGVSRNSFAALQWHRKAADQGEIDAQFELGVMYRDGLGTGAHGHLALYWFKRAADGGAPHALNAIGELYLDDRDIPQSFETAFEWFWIGAELGSAEAMYNIGMLYALGRGVVRDEIASFMWFDLAADFDPGRVHENAVRARTTLAERLTPSQVWAAKIRSRAWKHFHCCSPNITNGLLGNGIARARIE